MIPKHPRFESRTLLDAAQGQSCVLCEFNGKIAPCSRPNPTVVPAHLPGSLYGMPAGVAEKTHDWLVAHLCDHCHTKMDTIWRKDLQIRMLALCLTQQRLFEQGVLIVAKR